MSLSYQKYWFGIRDPGSGKNLFRIPGKKRHWIPDPGSVFATLQLSLVELEGASFIGPADEGSVPTPSTAGQIHEAPVNETSPTDKGHATATMHANSTPFAVDDAAARAGTAAAEVVGAAAAGVVGAAAAAMVGAAAAAGVGAAAAARIDAAAAGVGGAAVAGVFGASAATDGTERDACTPYERRSPVVAGLDSTPRGPAHPPPPSGPLPAQSHMAPEIEAKIPTHFH